MSAMFYDGTRMRHRYPGEKKGYSTSLVVAGFIGALLMAIGLAIRGSLERIFEKKK